MGESGKNNAIEYEGDHAWIYLPGTYICDVTDANGVSNGARVDIIYTGTAPLVVKDPEDVFVPANANGYYSASLTCEAISNSVDESELIYEWYAVRDLSYEPLGITGKTLYLGEDGTVEGQITRSYSCRVTDPTTGKSDRSKPAHVEVELSWIRAEQTGPNNLEFEFTGGKAPYFIGGYLYTEEVQKGTTVQHKKHYTVRAIKDLNQTVTLDDVGKWHTNNEYYKLKEDKEYYYYMSVSDSIGQKAEIEIPFTVGH